MALNVAACPDFWATPTCSVSLVRDAAPIPNVIRVRPASTESAHRPASVEPMPSAMWLIIVVFANALPATTEIPRWAAVRLKIHATPIHVA